MSRPKRIVYPGAWYHVFSRGTEVRPVFDSSAHGSAFLDVLGEAAAATGVEIHAYCLVADSYHLLLRTPQANLPQMMRQLNGQYAHWCRRQRGSDGRVFARRYRAILLEADVWLLPVSRYLHLQPVEYGMVEDPALYKWSSLRALGGKGDSPGWLQSRVIHRYAGGAEAYLRYVTHGVDAETAAFYARRRLTPVLGNPRIPSDQAQSRAEPATGIDEIIDAVAGAFAIDRKTIRTPRRGRGPQATPRAVAMLLARSPGGHSLKDIADAMDVRHVSTISLTVRRVRERLRDDSALRERVAGVMRSLGG